MLLCCAVPVMFWLCWRRLDPPGLWARATLLAGLILVVSPLVTIAAAKQEASTRHYLQILPAALVLGALATVGLRHAHHSRWAAFFFGGHLARDSLFGLFTAEAGFREQPLDLLLGPAPGHNRFCKTPGNSGLVNQRGVNDNHRPGILRAMLRGQLADALNDAGMNDAVQLLELCRVGENQWTEFFAINPSGGVENSAPKCGYEFGKCRRC